MIDEIESLIVEMHSTTEYKRTNLNRETLRASISHWLSSGDFVHLDNGCLMIGTTYAPFFGDDLMSCDVVLYVTPTQRGKGLAQKAIQEFIDWSKSKGAKTITIGQSSGVCFDQFDSIMTKNGLKNSGKTYMGAI